MKATYIKDLDGWSGDAALYKCDPPHEGYEYIIVSAVNAIFSGPETYIFGANENGEVVDWCEMDGSFRGALSHETALKNAGYEIVFTELQP